MVVYKKDGTVETVSFFEGYFYPIFLTFVVFLFDYFGTISLDDWYYFTVDFVKTNPFDFMLLWVLFGVLGSFLETLLSSWGGSFQLGGVEVRYPGWESLLICVLLGPVVLTYVVLSLLGYAWDRYILRKYLSDDEVREHWGVLDIPNKKVLTREEVERFNRYQSGTRHLKYVCRGDLTDRRHIKYSVANNYQRLGLMRAYEDGVRCPVCGCQDSWYHTVRTCKRAEKVEILDKYDFWLGYNNVVGIDVEEDGVDYILKVEVLRKEDCDIWGCLEVPSEVEFRDGIRVRVKCETVAENVEE